MPTTITAMTTATDRSGSREIATGVRPTTTRTPVRAAATTRSPWARASTRVSDHTSVNPTATRPMIAPAARPLRTAWSSTPPVTGQAPASTEGQRGAAARGAARREQRRAAGGRIVRLDGGEQPQRGAGLGGEHAHHAADVAVHEGGVRLGDLRVTTPEHVPGLWQLAD